MKYTTIYYTCYWWFYRKVSLPTSP